MKEPFRTLWWTLKQNRFPTGTWKYGVKLTNSEDAIYIGDDGNHCTVLFGTAGYHHTENGRSLNGQHEAYTTIESMLERAEYNPEFYSQTIIDALKWFKTNKSNM